MRNASVYKVQSSLLLLLYLPSSLRLWWLSAGMTTASTGAERAHMYMHRFRNCLQGFNL